MIGTRLTFLVLSVQQRGLWRTARESLVMVDPDPESGWDRRRSLLLSRYERVAWELFASRGFGAVTVDDIAMAAGVSSRTIYRYFPTKEDLLLGFTRQGTTYLVSLINQLGPSSNPLQTVWQLFRRHSLEDPPDVEILTLWRKAAADVPEVHSRVRGERTHELTDAVANYCTKSIGTDPIAVSYAHILAGMVVGVESAIIEMWGRSGQTLPEILEVAERAIGEWSTVNGPL